MRAGGRPGRARPGPARLGGDGSDGDGGKNSGGGAVRGRRRPHPPAAAAARLRLRSCCCSCSPAERGGRRRRHLPLAPASHHPRPVPLPLPLPLPGCSRRLLLGAARVSHQTPRPQCSAAPRGRRGDGSQNEAGPLGARRSLRGAGPISRWHPGRALPRGERASEAEAPGDPSGSQPKCSRLASGRARHGEVTGGRSFPRWARQRGHYSEAFGGLWRLLMLPRRERTCKTSHGERMGDGRGRGK